MDPAIMLYIWLGISILFGIVEALTVGLTSIWFAAGGLLAMISAAMRAPIWLQLIVFIITTATMLIITRPLARKFLVPKIEKTNSAGLIGKIAIVIEPIDNDMATGAARIEGKEWTARSESGEPIGAGIKVAVVRIEGVKLFVRVP